MINATVIHHNEAAPEFWTVQVPDRVPLLFCDFGRLLDFCRAQGIDPTIGEQCPDNPAGCEACEAFCTDRGKFLVRS